MSFYVFETILDVVSKIVKNRKKIVNGEKVYRSRFSLGFSHFFLEKAFADELFTFIYKEWREIPL